MPPKKKKKTLDEKDSYNSEELEELGIFDDEDEDSKEGTSESWRDYG